MWEIATLGNSLTFFCLLRNLRIRVFIYLPNAFSLSSFVPPLENHPLALNL